MLNLILRHVDMSWIISSNKYIKYEVDEINHQDLLNKVPWYNTDIEDFITHARTDRYNLMCSLVSYDKKLPAY